MHARQPIALPLERHTLSNGLRVVLHPDGSLPLVTVNLWYHVGSKNERPGRTGFAHLFEHMLFQGSQNVGTNEHFAHIQQVGGVANGSTARDRTNYYETLPSHHLELGLWLEADRMGFLLPAMTSEKLENQRQVVMNERRQRVDNQPYGQAMERLYELAYPAGHPYHWPIIGYMEDIEAATLDDIQAFFDTYYRPNNAVLTLAGSFEPAAALDAVERYFGDLEAGAPPPPVVAPPPPMDGEKRALLRDDVQLPRIYAAYRAPKYGAPGWYAADLLATALGSGKSSPLYQDLVYRRQIAQDAGYYIFDTEEAATLLAVATAAPDTDPAELEQALLEPLEAAGALPPAEEHLERARNSLVSQHYASLARLDTKADRLSQLTTYFDQPELLGTEVDRYLDLSAEDVRRLAADICRPEGRTVVTVLPREEG